MQAFGILLLLGLAIVVVVFPIVALAIASSARRKAEGATERLRQVELQLALMRRKLAERPAATEPAPAPAVSPIPAAPAPEPPATPPPVPAATPELPPLPPVSVDWARLAPAAAPAPPAPAPEAPPPLQPVVAQVAVPPPPPAARFNWEQFMGVKLFAWLGGLALFVSAIFFLQYAFEHDWVPAPVRAALTFLVGAGLLVGGLWSIRRNYAVTGQTLCATGVVVLYAVTFACRAYYGFPFFTALPTFLLMTLITATAFLLAVRLQAQVVAILGLLGGFLTPVLIHTGQDNPLGLFGYLALLDLGLLAVVLHRRWHHLAPLAALGTVALQVGWMERFFGLHNLPTAVFVDLGFSALFAGAVGLARRLARPSSWLATAAVVPPAAALAFSLYFISESAIAPHPGWILGNVLLADLALLAVAALHRGFARLHVFAGLAAFGVAALWIGEAATAELLPWAFGFLVLAAGQHGLFPFVLARLEPEADGRPWSALFPQVGLGALLIVLARFAEVGLEIWLVVLLLNGLALAAAAAARRPAALASALLLTLVVLALAIVHQPHSPAGGRLELGLVAGCALFFCGGSAWLVRRCLAPSDNPAVAAPGWLVQLPAVSATLPFVLLAMLVLKLQLPDPTEAFGVALLLIALLLGIGAVARQGGPTLAALGGALLLEYAWFSVSFHGGSAALGLAWFLGFAALFLLHPFALQRRLLATQPPWAAAALALPLHFPLVLRGIDALWPQHGMPGTVAAVAALPPLAGLLALLRRLPADSPLRLNRLAWFGGATLFFLTLAFPLQFNDQPQWITISWALEGAALLWLFHRLPHPGLRLTGVGLLAAVFVRLVANPAVLHYGAAGHPVVFNWILATYGLAAGCCFIGAKWLASPRHLVLGVAAPPVLATFGTILTFVLVNLEIADAFTPPGSPIRLTGAGHFARDMSYPLAWTAFGLGLVWLGVRRQWSMTRLAGVALLGTAAAWLLLDSPVLGFGARRSGSVFVWLLVTYGATAAGCFAGARALAAGEDRAGPLTAKALLAALGTGLAFALVNLAIADHFAPAGPRLRLEFSGNFARDMSYTIAWAGFAVALLIAGIARRLAAARYAAIALLGLTFLKLIFHDLANLDAIYRIAAFFVVSIAAIAVSFLYQRYLRSDDPPQP